MWDLSSQPDPLTHGPDGGEDHSRYTGAEADDDAEDEGGDHFSRAQISPLAFTSLRLAILASFWYNFRMKKPHGGQRREYPIRTEGGSAFIPLSRGFEAQIDETDLALVSGVSWHASGGSPTYAVRLERIDKTEKRRVISMHRLILGDAAGMVVDHINGNTLDNRRANLRHCTHGQNQQNRRASNSLGIKGVYQKRGKYAARITLAGQVKNLGTFATPELAGEAYRVAAEEAFGEFAISRRPTDLPAPKPQPAC